MRQSVLPFFFLITALISSGCGDKITNANLQAVNDALKSAETRGRYLSPKEVESILGQPDRVETFKIPLETQKPLLDGVRYYYEQNGKTVELHFVDNKLIERADMWPEPAAAPPAGSQTP